MRTKYLASFSVLHEILDRIPFIQGKKNTEQNVETPQVHNLRQGCTTLLIRQCIFNSSRIPWGQEQSKGGRSWSRALHR